MNTRKILIAVDGSQPSNRAFEWYLNNMKRDGDEVTLLHAPEYKVDFGFLPGAMANVEQITKSMKGEDERVQSMMQPYTDKLRSENVKSHQLVKPGEKPGETIVKMAEEEGTSSIIMGSRGLGTIRRTLTGSVSDYVLQHAPKNCAVTIIH